MDVTGYRFCVWSREWEALAASFIPQRRFIAAFFNGACQFVRRNALNFVSRLNQEWVKSSPGCDRSKFSGSTKSNMVEVHRLWKEHLRS